MTDHQAFHLSEFWAIANTAAGCARERQSSTPLTLYECLNALEVFGWLRLGAATEYFASTAWENQQDRYIQLWYEARDHATKHEGAIFPALTLTLPSYEHPDRLTAGFQTALSLQADLLHGDYGEVLDLLARAADTTWITLVLAPNLPDPDKVADALQEPTPNHSLATLLAQYFRILDHMAAFQDLFHTRHNLIRPDHRAFERDIGTLVRWRLDFFEPTVDRRFRDLTHRATQVLQGEFERIGAPTSTEMQVFLARVTELVNNWKDRGEGPTNLNPLSGPFVGPASGKPQGGMPAFG